MLSLVVLLFAVACGLTLLHWRWTGRVLLLLALVLLFGVGCGPIPSHLLRNLQSGYSDVVAIREAPRSAIILLGNGTERVPSSPVSVEVGALAYGRLMKALELYQACKRKGGSCTVLVTGGDPLHHGASEAAVYSARLQLLGVDPGDLLIEDRSLNTWQNAQFTAALLKAHPVDQLYLVTSGIHVRRAVLYFGHFGLHGQSVRADYVNAMPSLTPQSYNFLVTDLAVHEYVGYWRYFIYERMGWNVAAARPGSL
jgi:uncharacterized SAM-binding protein YcdF (DUF218 family)